MRHFQFISDFEYDLFEFGELSIKSYGKCFGYFVICWGVRNFNSQIINPIT
jgi:hypothetical protein